MQCLSGICDATRELSVECSSQFLDVIEQSLTAMTFRPRKEALDCHVARQRAREQDSDERKEADVSTFE
jgi:hypothetical protein